MARTRAKGKKIVKMVVEAEDRRKMIERAQALLEKMSEKTNHSKVGEE